MKKQKIVNLFVGSNNQGKIKEIRALLPKNLKILTPKDYSLDSPKENGRTFDENSVCRNQCPGSCRVNGSDVNTGYQVQCWTDSDCIFDRLKSSKNDIKNFCKK